MDIMEVILLVVGAGIFVLSFFVSTKQEKVSEGTKENLNQEIKTLVADEMQSVKGQVSDVVEEAVNYSMERTQRSMERLSNEKIMAVSEYSDTVLEEIHKAHEEVMFLYDMLNDKHTNLKNTVSEINRTVKEAAETTREAEEVVNSFQKLTPENVQPAEEKVVEPAAPQNIALEQISPDDMDTAQKSEEQGQNNNDKIREMYRTGKSIVEIAKELNLGVGEVKLVLDLFQNQ